jgi:hypothetical protein
VKSRMSIIATNNRAELDLGQEGDVGQQVKVQ